MLTTSESALRHEDADIRAESNSPSHADPYQSISLQGFDGHPRATRKNDTSDTTTKDGDTFDTQWEGEDDPMNPHNWSAWTTNSNAALIAFLSFLMPLASSICAPGVPEIMKEFNNSSPELAAFVMSVYVLGFAFGPLLFAPLSEIYGRVIIYHICNIGFIAFVIGCALAPSLGSLIAFRFLSGVFGSCPITNGGASIADMIQPERRGAYMGLVSIGPLLGPIIGPVSGSFLSAAKGWRWTFWLIAILGGFTSVIMVLLARETYGPVILRRRKCGGFWPSLKSDNGFSASEHLRRGFVRPVKLLVLSPISAICALYLAIVYGYLYLMFSSITQVFEENYGFASNIVGLVFLGLGLGSLIGIAITSGTSDRTIKHLKSKGQEVKPEFRLRLVPIGGFLLPAGLFLYGWTCQYHVFWIVPIIGMVIIGVGNMIIFMSVVLYLIDAFALYEASALAANTFIRSIGGALLPLVGLKLFDSLGMGWGNSLLGFLAAALIPVPFLLLRYGEWLRRRFEVKNL